MYPATRDRSSTSHLSDEDPQEPEPTCDRDHEQIEHELEEPVGPPGLVVERLTRCIPVKPEQLRHRELHLLLV